MKILQQHALCTYKDEDLPADERFPGAREILRAADLNDETPSQETLGLAGTIEKQQWRLNGQRRYFDRLFAYYDRAPGRRSPAISGIPASTPHSFSN